MTFVVVANFIHLMIPVLSEEEDIFFIKKKGPKGYFYYNGSLPEPKLLHHVKQLIAKKLSSVYVVECYGMYNGMMDFSPYLSKKTKDAHPYYNNPKKELSDKELKDFLESNHLN